MKKSAFATSMTALFFLAACGSNDKSPTVQNEPGLTLAPGSGTSGAAGLATMTQTGSLTSIVTGTATTTSTESSTSTHSSTSIATSGTPTSSTTGTQTSTNPLHHGFVGENPYRFPIMAPSSGGQSPYAWNSGVNARAGQRVYVGFSGRWGTQDTRSRAIFGQTFKIKYDPRNKNCDELDFNGRQRVGELSTHEGQPAGLRAAILGSPVNFPIGENGSFTADRDGPVVLGLNTPALFDLCFERVTFQISPGY